MALDAAAGSSSLFKAAAELIDSIIGKQVDLGLVQWLSHVKLLAAAMTPAAAAAAARRRWSAALKMELVS